MTRVQRLICNSRVNRIKYNKYTVSSLSSTRPRWSKNRKDARQLKEKVDVFQEFPWNDRRRSYNDNRYVFQIRSPTDETRCVACPEGTLPDADHQRCLDIPEVFLRIGSSWGIGAMSLSAAGVTVTLLVVAVFVKHNHTPIVKAAGREVSYVLLSGILLCYMITFVLVLKPTNIVCAVQR